jgi:hypothetical protein
MTTDPDAKGFKGALEMYNERNSGTETQTLLDTRHLSENHRKFVKNAKFVENMMPGRTVSDRKKIQLRFSNDIAMRCQAEFEQAFKQHAGNIPKFTHALSYTRDAIVQCYQGRHNKCKRHSFVCTNKMQNWLKKSSFLSSDFKIATCAQNNTYLQRCIDYRLGSNILELTKFNTNTQKCEAVNKCIRKSLPRHTTFSRNFAARAHSAVHTINNGPAESLIKLSKDMGCTFPHGSKVVTHLNKLEHNQTLQLKRKGETNYKTKRCQKRKALYEIYEKHQSDEQYKKNCILRNIGPKRE